LEVFSNLLFYNYMECRKAQVLREISELYPRHLLFNQTYESPLNVFNEVLISGKTGWQYPWKVDFSDENFGIQEHISLFSSFQTAKPTIMDLLDKKHRLFIWTRNKFTPHMVDLQSNPEGIHSLAILSYEAESDTFTIFDYPFERRYSSKIISEAFDHVPEYKRTVSFYETGAKPMTEDNLGWIQKKFNNTILNAQDDFTLYDHYSATLKHMGAEVFIQRSMHMFGIISLSRLLTSIFIEKFEYSDAAVFKAREIALYAENIKNGFMKDSFNPSRLDEDKLGNKLERLKQLEEAFLQSLIDEVQTGKKESLQLKSLDKPKVIHPLRITDSSIGISWEADEAESSLTEYEIFANNQLVGISAVNEFIIGNLQSDTEYKIGIRAKNQFNMHSPECIVVAGTQKQLNEGHLSAYKPVFASSSESPIFNETRVTDSNAESRWSSEYSDNQWIYVDLGAIKDINLIRLNWENAFATKYEVVVSTDMKNWSLVDRVEDGRAGIYEIRSSLKARYVKVNCIARATIFGFSLWDLSVYQI